MVPAVPCTSSVESPLIAAARCSLTHVLAVPGTPSSSSARSVASVATAISIRRCCPTYFGLMSTSVRRRARPARRCRRSTQDVADDGPRRQQPARGSRPVVDRGERSEFACVEILGVRPQDVVASIRRRQIVDRSSSADPTDRPSAKDRPPPEMPSESSRRGLTVMYRVRMYNSSSASIDDRVRARSARDAASSCGPDIGFEAGQR